MKKLIYDKKGITGESLVTALIIFTGCLSLLVLMVGSLANDYSNDDVVDPAFSEQFDKFDESTEIAGDMYDSLNDEGGLSLYGASELFFTAGFSVIDLLFSSVATASSIMFTFPTYFGMDTTSSIIMMTIIFSILTVSIVFVVINSLRGNKL